MAAREPIAGKASKTRFKMDPSCIEPKNHIEICTRFTKSAKIFNKMYSLSSIYHFYKKKKQSITMSYIYNMIMTTRLLTHRFTVNK